MDIIRFQKDLPYNDGCKFDLQGLASLSLRLNKRHTHRDESLFICIYESR